MSKVIYPGQEGGPPAAFTQPLQRPIPNAEANLVSEISFREPTAGDIMSIGNPVKTDLYADPVTFSFIDEKMGLMMERLSVFPQTMLTRMHPQDYVACCWGLAGFFVPAGLMQL